MVRQTIALFRFQLLSIINARVFMVLCGIVIASLVSGFFISELALLNRESIALAVMAEVLRYSLLIFLIITICQHVSQSYEMAQFASIVSMPINRSQYIASLVLLVIFVSLLFSSSIIVACILFAPTAHVMFWTLSVFIELMLAGFIALLAAVALEKLSIAFIFSIAFYLLAKITPLIAIALDSSIQFYAKQLSHQFAAWFFSGLLYLLPGFEAFAQNNLLFESELPWSVLIEQFSTVVIYSTFIIVITLIDFYRKEFSQ